MPVNFINLPCGQFKHEGSGWWAGETAKPLSRASASGSGFILQCEMAPRQQFCSEFFVALQKKVESPYQSSGQALHESR